jgi:hypothetical protein
MAKHTARDHRQTSDKLSFGNRGYITAPARVAVNGWTCAQGTYACKCCERSRSLLRHVELLRQLRQRGFRVCTSGVEVVALEQLGHDLLGLPPQRIDCAPLVLVVGADLVGSGTRFAPLEENDQLADATMDEDLRTPLAALETALLGRFAVAIIALALLLTLRVLRALRALLALLAGLRLVRIVSSLRCVAALGICACGLALLLAAAILATRLTTLHHSILTHATLYHLWILLLGAAALRRSLIVAR